MPGVMVRGLDNHDQEAIAELREATARADVTDDGLIVLEPPADALFSGPTPYDDTDVLGAALGATTVAWWEHGDSLLTTEEITWTKHIIEDTFSGFPAWVYATDLDGDEDVDVLAADHGTEAGNAPIIWWENDGSPADGGWTEHSIENDYWVWRGVYATDEGGDGDVDILGPAFGDNVVAWWENDGTPRDGGWIEHLLDSEFSLALSVYATDLDGDQDTDVLGAALGANTVAWWENVTHELYQPLLLKNYAP